MTLSAMCPRCQHFVSDHGQHGCKHVEGGLCCPCPASSVPGQEFNLHSEIPDDEVWD
jgi:hypothetical protein